MIREANFNDLKQILEIHFCVNRKCFFENQQKVVLEGFVN